MSRFDENILIANYQFDSLYFGKDIAMVNLRIAIDTFLRDQPNNIKQKEIQYILKKAEKTTFKREEEKPIPKWFIKAHRKVKEECK